MASGLPSTDELKRLTNEFSQDFDVLRLLMHEPKLCTMHELQTVYTLDDFYNFLEMIDAQETLRDEADKKRQADRNKSQGKHK